MIDAHMVAMVKRYLAASAERSEAVDIASILWTIDAKEKAVPSREEINTALSEVPGLRVSCNGGKVFLSAVGEASELTSAHFDTAYSAYQSTVAPVIGKVSTGIAAAVPNISFESRRSASAAQLKR